MLYFIGAAVLLVLVFFFLLYLIYRRVFYSPKKRIDYTYDLQGEAYRESYTDMVRMIEELRATPFEPIFIKAQDGMPLFARYYHVKDGAPLQIQFHGYHGAAIRDFCGGCKFARKEGQNVLLVDQRGAGESGGVTVSFGIKEHYDVLAWVNYATKRFGQDTPIFLTGISMGGATVLMASSLQLPKNVIGVIADCPFDHPSFVIEKVVGKLGYPVKATMSLIRLAARIYGGFNLDSWDALRAVEQTNLPLLIIHGTKDSLVPSAMSERIKEHAGDKCTLLLVEGAEHGLSYMTAPERYETAIRSFVSRCLSNVK